MGRPSPAVPGGHHSALLLAHTSLPAAFCWAGRVRPTARTLPPAPAGTRLSQWQKQDWCLSSKLHGLPVALQGLGFPSEPPTPRSKGGHTQPPPSLAKWGQVPLNSGMLGPLRSHADSVTWHFISTSTPSFTALGKRRPGAKQGPGSLTGSGTGLGVRQASRLALSSWRLGSLRSRRPMTPQPLAAFGGVAAKQGLLSDSEAKFTE